MVDALELHQDKVCPLTSLPNPSSSRQCTPASVKDQEDQESIIDHACISNTVAIILSLIRTFQVHFYFAP